MDRERSRAALFAVPISILWISLFGGFALRHAAARPLCRIEQPVLVGEHLQVLATQVTLEGRPQRGTAWAIEGPAIDQTAGPLRQRLGTAQDAPIFFVLLIEASVAYAPATEPLRAALKRFLAALPAESRGQLWRFAEQTEGLSGFRPPADLFADASRYNAAVEGNLRLLRSLQRAQAELSQAPPGSRRALVLISDGRNTLMDRKEFYNVGEELGQKEVPVYAVGFSPEDVRGPLRNLGDLAKRSGGTFRWARRAEDLGPQLLNLVEELTGAQVLTFDGRHLATQGTASDARLRLRCGAGSSNFARLRTIPKDNRHPFWGALGILALSMLLLWRLPRWRQRTAAIGSAATRPMAAAATEPPTPTAPPSPAAAMGPRLIAADGRQVPVEDRLDIGIGLEGRGTLSLRPGEAQVLCVLFREGTGQKLQVKSAVVRLNGRQLLGAMRLHDGDRIGVEHLGEWVFRAS